MLRLVKAAALAGMSLCAMSSYAATVTMVGTTMTYVYEDSQPALTLFGAPTLVGDIVLFNQVNFRAESIDGVASDIASANFTFTEVYANDATKSVGAFLVQESGDYEITNGDSVSGLLRLQVTNLSPTTPFFSLVDRDSFGAAGDSAGAQEWQMSALVDVEQEGEASNKVTVGIQNTLEAKTNAFGDTAWIEKKLAFVAVEEGGTLPPIPIPAAAWLFGSALLGLMGVARRKRA